MRVDGFAAPAWFVLLVAIGLVVVGYVLVQRRRKRRVLRFANLSLLESVAPRRPAWPRHAPATLFVIAFVLLTIGLAGPVAQARVPRDRAVVLLVVDVSLSMESTDITPSRIKAAQASATTFVQGMTPGINLGLETFGGSATVEVAPTTDRAPVLAAINTVKLQESTATGDAIAAARQAIQQFATIVPGGPLPARIVLMSDGKQTVGRDEFAEATACGAAKIPISTISFYDSIVGSNVTLGALSLVMKGEHLTQDSSWHGIPAQPDLQSPPAPPQRPHSEPRRR